MTVNIAPVTIGRMKVTYDPTVDAAYIYLVPIARGGAKSTYCCPPNEVGCMLNLDFDAEGRLIGIEVIGASARLPPQLLQDAGPSLAGTPPRA